MASNLEEAKTLLAKNLLETIRSKGSVAQKITGYRNIIKTAKKLGEAKKTYEAAPKKLTVDMPVFSETLPFTDIEVKNIIPFGFLIPSQAGSKELAEPDYVKLVETGATDIYKYEPVFEPYRRGKLEAQEIKVTPHPILKDELEFGKDISEEMEKGLTETYPEEKYQIPGVPPIELPEFKLPDLGDLGKWLLIGGAGLISILLLTRK